MEPETVFIISDDSDDSSGGRRKQDEQDPLEGKRILRKKKPKVKRIFFALSPAFMNETLSVLD